MLSGLADSIRKFAKEQEAKRNIISSSSGDIKPSPLSSIPGMEEGRKVGFEEYNKYGWGTANIQPAIGDIMSRYQARLAGYNAPELAAQRAEQSQMINSQMLAAQRQARAQQAAQGVRGASALAGVQNISDQAINARAMAENQLLAKQAEMQRQSLQDYANAVLSERGTALGSIYGMANLAQQGAQANRTNDLLEKYVNSTGNAASAAAANAEKVFGKDNTLGMKPFWDSLTPTQQAALLGVPFAAQGAVAEGVEGWVPSWARNPATQPYRTVSNEVSSWFGR